MKATNEARVGAVLLAAIALVIGGYIYFSGVGFGAQQYYLRLLQPVHVPEGAEVRLQGVPIGVVQSVTLDAATQKPLLTLAINRHDPPYQLRQSYTYRINSSSLLGQPYVDISGTVTADNAIYQPNDPTQVILAKASDFGTIKDAFVDEMQETMQQLNLTLKRINTGILSGDNQKNLTKALEGLAALSQRASKSMGPGGIKVALGDQKAAKALRQTLINSAAAAAAINRTSDLASQLMVQNRERANHIFINLQKSSQQTVEVMGAINNLLQNSGIQENAPQTFAALRQAAENIKVATAGFKSLGEKDSVDDIQQSLTSLRQSSDALRDATLSIKTLLTDPILQGQFKSTFASLQQISQTLEQTSQNLNEASVGLKNVLGDAQLQKDLKASAAQLRSTLTSASSAAARVNDLLGGDDSSDSNTENLPKTASANNYPHGLDFTYRYLDKAPEHHYGDLTFNTDLFGGPFRLGLSGIGEENGFTLQTGKYVGDGAVRYGLYRSKLGVGAGYYWKRFSVEANLWDPNDSSWNAYVGVELSPSLQILLGREHIGDMHSTALGVRLTR